MTPAGECLVLTSSYLRRAFTRRAAAVPRDCNFFGAPRSRISNLISNTSYEPIPGPFGRSLDLAQVMPLGRLVKPVAFLASVAARDITGAVRLIGGGWSAI